MAGGTPAGVPGNPDLRHKPQLAMPEPAALRQIHIDHLPAVGEVAATVRRSSKWQTGVKTPHAVGRRPVVGEEIEVIKKGKQVAAESAGVVGTWNPGEQVIGKIKIEQVHYLMFDQVPAKLTSIVDNPNGRTYQELLALMRFYYGPGFNETEWVTVLVYRRIA